MNNINLKKLAQQLNLSVSTVSKAFHDSYDISPVTKERILELARQLNYQPNPLARGLRKQKSHTIALVIPEVANNFFSLAINGIESVAQEKGYHVLIYLTHEDYHKEVACIQHLQNGRADGVLLSLSDGSRDTAHLDNLYCKGIPLVFFDRVCEHMPTTKVTTDDFESGYKATQHLIEQGCTRIAHLYLKKNLSITNKRMEGFLKAMEDHQLPVPPEFLVGCEDHPERNYQLIKELLSGSSRPEGIFSSFEKLALVTYHVCEELRMSIPNDLQVVSFSNLETASLLNPSLTTITQPAYEMGRRAALSLFEALDHPTVSPPNKKIILASDLIKGNSTRNYHSSTCCRFPSSPNKKSCVKTQL
jgi:LacI family transcriptional regulator